MNVATNLTARTTNLSAAEVFARLPPEQKKKELASISLAHRAALKYSWQFWGRPNQQMPPGDWFVWLVLAGRGWGKTRTATENIARMVQGPTPLSAPPGAPAIMSIVADTPFDLRQYCIEGPSGFLNIGIPEYRPTHQPSTRTLTWPNGCKALLFSAEDPDTLRGASGSFFWWDELAKARYAIDCWNNMMFGMREGNPRGMITTTPRPLPLLKELIAKESTVITKGSTWENKSNLSPKYYQEVIAPLMGTRLGRQEIEAEILDDLPGALWNRALIDDTRVNAAPDMNRIVVAIDPSGTSGNTSDEKADDVGIIVAGRGVDGHCYVLADRTCNLSPDGWGRRAVTAFREYQADRIVAERNFGGAMVAHVIKTIDPRVPYKELTASRNKVVRAEPVAALYEQGRVHHVGSLPHLEDQMCMIASDGYVGEGSPDRADAMVWAITELMLQPTYATGTHAVLGGY